MNLLNRLTLLATALFISTLLLSLNLCADELQDARQLRKLGKANQALTKVNSWLVNKPKDIQGRFLKGLILSEQGKTHEAIIIYTELTKDYPNLPEPYNNLAALYAGLSQYDKAKSALEMAIGTHPSYATAQENLGVIYAKMASLAYDRALQLDSSNTATQAKLAMIQELVSDKSRTKPASAGNFLNSIQADSTKPAPATNETPAKIASNTLKPPAIVKPIGVEKLPEVIKPVEVVKKPEVTKLADAVKPTKALKPVVADQSREVQNTLESWAAAWAAQNVKKYLSFYASDFKTPNGETRTNWAATRRDRISKPKHIDVNVSNVIVNINDSTHVTVKFHQDYRASHFKAEGTKTMVMVKSSGNWLVQEERAY
jgi:hypothetical protein